MSVRKHRKIGGRYHWSNCLLFDYEFLLRWMTAGYSSLTLKGLKSKAGKPYDAYIIPSGTEEYHYTKDGAEKSGVQFKFVMEFPKKKSSGGKKK